MSIAPWNSFGPSTPNALPAAKIAIETSESIKNGELDNCSCAAGQQRA